LYFCFSWQVDFDLPSVEKKDSTVKDLMFGSGIEIEEQEEGEGECEGEEDVEEGDFRLRSRTPCVLRSRMA